jgi:hypothetical protein
MRYMCLVYVDEEKMAAFAKDSVTIGAKVVAYDQELNNKGVLVMASPLKRVREAVTIRVRDGRMSATDGPFAETKEQLGGFMLIDARPQRGDCSRRTFAVGKDRLDRGASAGASWLA